jgi:GMP synthase (glutamine-hydrolysing)
LDIDVLALIHGSDARAGVFSDSAAASGHAIEEWSLAWGTPPPRPIDAYDAVLVFGGVMHADQDHLHPWLREESMLLQRLLDLQVPVLGVCLGAQLIARAAGAAVGPSSEPEVGWRTVELTAAARDDPLFSGLPARFEAFQWHFYTHGIPAGGVELARSRVCTQAFRLGEAAWGVQFHPEVTAGQIEGWTSESPEDLSLPAEGLIAESLTRIDEWNEFGRTLCSNFLAIAEGLRAAA